MSPLLILLLGTLVVILCIVRLRIGAFFGLMLAAFLVSFLAPGAFGDKLPRVVAALGTAAGKLAVIISCAALIGKCMTDSGAADRIVRTFLRLLGERRAPAALMSSGFVLGMPVFFDTVFYLLVPLARSLHRSTKKNYLLYILAMAGGAVATHTLVPPTPGPLAVAELLKVDVGMMILMGLAVALPSALVALGLAHWLQARYEIPMRALPGEDVDRPAPADSDLPGFWVSVLPIALPVVLMAAGTVFAMQAKTAVAGAWVLEAAEIMKVAGDPNFALMVATLASVLVYVRQRRPSREQLSNDIEESMMSAGTIILITAAGGAFGAMLKEAGVGPAIQNLFGGGGSAGLILIVVAWVIAALLKTAQGSTTVAMITSAGMMASMLDGQVLAFHPVYLALAVGFGGLCVVWMNDSGFWIIARMSGMTELEVLKTWSFMLVLVSLFGLALTALLAVVLPLAPAVAAAVGG
jgi:GntP family gluconate:H+ symporter